MEQVYTTLFDQDKNENLLQWEIFTDGSEVVIRRGRVGTKIAESRTISKAKNVGKKNETTGFTQAIADAESKWRKQIKKGYTENKEDVGTTVTLAPLAKKYQDSAKHVDWENGAVVLTKYDGVRMTAFYRNGEVFFQSRGGEAYPVIAEIAETLKANVFDKNPSFVVDGELYCHGMYLEDITSAVKKHNGDTPKLSYVVFDLYNPNDKEQGYQERLLHAVLLLSMEQGIVVADADVLTSEEAMLKSHDQAVADGYEGVVIRSTDGLFKFNQRDVSFIKYKVRHRAEYVTIKPIECKNGSVKIQCKVVHNGEVKLFEPAMLGTIEQQQRVLSPEGWAKYNTGYGTIEYEAISKYGIPAKAKFVAFRECDSKGLPVE